MNITPEQVKAVLTALAEDFTIEIPAVHNKEGYWVEFTELNAYLILAGEGNNTPERIAEYING